MWCYPPFIDVETEAQRHKAAWHAHITIKGQAPMIQTSPGLYLQSYLKAQWSDGSFVSVCFGLFLPPKCESYLTDDTSLPSRIVSAIFPAPSTMADPKPATKNCLRDGVVGHSVRQLRSPENRSPSWKSTNGGRFSAADTRGGKRQGKNESGLG